MLIEIWEVVKQLLVIGLIAGICLAILRYVPMIPQVVRQIGYAIVLILTLVIIVDQIVIPRLT